ncbi:helix-turn-helix domain-containing protein [Chromobacterium fluminis]
MGHMKTVGDRIRHARQQAKLSQKALARRAGVGTSTIGSLECGRSNSTTLLIPIAKALSVNPSWLSTGKGDPKAGHVSSGAYAQADNIEELAQQIADKGIAEIAQLIGLIMECQATKKRP